MWKFCNYSYWKWHCKRENGQILKQKFLYNIFFFITYTDVFQWIYSFRQKLWGCWTWKESFKQFVGRCSLRPDFLVNQLWQLQMQGSPLLTIFFFFQTRPVGHRFFAKQKQFLTCLSLKSYKATMDSRRRQGARLPKLTQGGCWCLWQHRPSNLHAARCFSIPYLLDLHKLCKHNAVMYLKELTRELKGNKRSQDKKVSIAKENGDKL